MLKRELKYNFKSFLIWTIALIILFALVFWLYSSFITSENIDNINELMKVFPPEVLKMFNLDITHIDTAFGWMETEGFIFILLITGVYSAMLGGNILTKEEDDKTIEYLHSLPVKRTNIVLAKVLTGLIYVISMILILGIADFICLNILEDFDKKLFVILSLTPILSNIVIFTLSLYISSYTHKTKKVLPINLALVFISYILVTIAELSEKVKFVKYFSIYTLADTRGVITNSSINIYCLIISIVLTILLISLTLTRYNKKELV